MENKLIEKLPKTVKTSIVIIPKQDVWKSIQEIRKIHDKSYYRWMPHINLIYPFVIPKYFKKIAKPIKEVIHKKKIFFY
jgi:hypothetical protein